MRVAKVWRATWKVTCFCDACFLYYGAETDICVCDLVDVQISRLRPLGFARNDKGACFARNERMAWTMSRFLDFALRASLEMTEERFARNDTCSPSPSTPAPDPATSNPALHWAHRPFHYYRCNIIKEVPPPQHIPDRTIWQSVL